MDRFFRDSLIISKTLFLKSVQLDYLYLTKNELQFSKPLSTERRFEFLIGRQELRKLLKSITNTIYTDDILPNKNGFSPIKLPISYSIAHSKEKISIACSSVYESIGIDLLKTNSFTKNHLKFLNRVVDSNIVDLKSAHTILSLKEAAIKALYPCLKYKPLFQDIIIRDRDIIIKNIDFNRQIFYTIRESKEEVIPLVYIGEKRDAYNRNGNYSKKNFFTDFDYS